MFDDIIEGKVIKCNLCWWSIRQGHNPDTTPGEIYCSLYKRKYSGLYYCNSWRDRSTRLKINLIGKL